MSGFSPGLSLRQPWAPISQRLRRIQTEPVPTCFLAPRIIRRYATRPKWRATFLLQLVPHLMQASPETEQEKVCFPLRDSMTDLTKLEIHHGLKSWTTHPESHPQGSPRQTAAVKSAESARLLSQINSPGSHRFPYRSKCRRLEVSSPI